MERKVQKLEHCHTEVTVNVDKDLWKKAQEKALKAQQKAEKAAMKATRAAEKAK